MAAQSSASIRAFPQTENLSYFENPDSSRALARSFGDGLHKSVPNVTIVKPLAGSSGHTFLCTLPGQFLKGVEKVHDVAMIHFVLKFDHLVDVEAEQRTSQLLRLYNFSAPCMQIIPEDDTMQIKPAACKEDQFLENVFSQLRAVVMYQFRGHTFESLIVTGKILQIKREEWERIFEEMGRIVVFDLVTLNDDRIARFTTNPPSLSGNKTFNTGNVMVEFNVKDQSLKAVHFIDNSPRQLVNMIRQSERKSSSDYPSIAGFFSESDDQLGNANPLSQEAREAESFSSKDSQTPQEIDIEGLHEAFKVLISNRDNLREHVFGTIQNTLTKDSKLDAQSEMFQLLGPALTRGFREAFHAILQNPDNVNLFKQTEFLSEKLQVSLHQLVERNIQHILNPKIHEPYTK